LRETFADSAGSRCASSALDHVQLHIRRRLEVLGEVRAEEEIVHEGLVLLVGEIRLDDFVEELGILARQKEVQFVAGVFRILRALFLVLHLRPLENPRELGELGVAVEGGEE
jgi:hypothetical protein